MAVSNTVSLRSLTNHPSAAAFSGSSPNYVLFSEDWLKVRSALDTGSLGIRTYSVQIQETSTTNDALLCAGKATITGNVALGGTLEVTGASTLTGAVTMSAAATVGTTLDVTGLATFAVGATLISGNLTVSSGNVAVTGNITVFGSVDGLVDLYGHTHTGTTDGAAIAAGGYAAGSIAFADIAAAAFGLTGSHIARGDSVANTRTALDGLMNKIIHVGVEQFSGMTNVGDYDATPTVTRDSFGGTAGMPAWAFAQGDEGDASDLMAATVHIPDDVDAAGSAVTVTFYVGVSTAVTAAKDITMTACALKITPGDGGDSTEQVLLSGGTTAVTTITNANTAKRALPIPVSLTATNYAAGDLLLIGIQRSTPTATDVETAYLVGASVQFAPLYA